VYSNCYIVIYVSKLFVYKGDEFEASMAYMNSMGEPMTEQEYMEQEEEWEREGLLDPAWEKQQKKVRHYLKISLKNSSNFRNNDSSLHLF